MELTRRSFLAASLASLVPAELSATQSEPAIQFPWADLKRRLQNLYPDLRRHFVFEYYPWYANSPFRHWQQWDRVPPLDLAANIMPRLGAYDSRATRVLEQHALWIAESGVGVVNLSWWGRGSFSDSTVSYVMDVMAAHDIRVTFHLEPYGPLRVERLASDLQYLLREFGEKRRWDCFFLHQRADGTQGPVFKLFATTLPEKLKDCHGVLREVPGYTSDDLWRRAIEEAHTLLDGDFPHITLLSDTWDAGRVRTAGLNGIATYDPAIEPDQHLNYALNASRQGMLFSFNVNPGWDEIDRRTVEPGSCYQPRPFLPRTRELDWSTINDRELARQLSERRILESFQSNLFLQTHPWLGNVAEGFFLTYITSFNEWHEGTSFEPMRDEIALTPAERSFEYHNADEGDYRLRYLTELIGRLV